MIKYMPSGQWLEFRKELEAHHGKIAWTESLPGARVWRLYCGVARDHENERSQCTFLAIDYGTDKGFALFRYDDGSMQDAIDFAQGRIRR